LEWPLDAIRLKRDNQGMALGKHQKTSKGTIRRERGDSQAGNLKQDYPEFGKVPPNTRLDTLRDKFGVDSLNGVRKALRKQKP
jgi:hypothetical protein